MKPLPLNLASRPFRNNLLVGTLLTAAGIALVGGTAYNLYVYLSYGAAYATLQRAQTDDRARITTLQKQERDLAAQIKARDFKSTYGRGKLASELISKSAFSWTQLFNTLETVIPPDVVLAAIRPNISSDGIVLRLEGVAKSHGALLTFEEKLLDHSSFKRVKPIGERRLNPNLPDITFLLSTDYIPPSQQPPVVTAANPDAAAAAPATATGDTAAGTTGAPAATTGAAAAAAPADPGATTAVAAVGAPPAPAAAATAATAASAEGAKSAASGGVVGRDGQPKSASDSVIAPGGLLIAEAVAAPLPSKGKKDSRKPAARTTPAPDAAAGAAKTPPQAASRPGSQRAASAGAAAATAGSAAGVPPGQRSIATPRGYDPNVPRTMPTPLAASAHRPKPAGPPARAERLDVQLSFVARPAAEVYRTLAQAHGVQIHLDPTVDSSAPVTMNLHGRRLEEALLLLSGALHNQTTHPSEGVYRIFSQEVRSPGGDKPPTEEPIVEEIP